MTTEDALPELPEKSYLGDDASYGYDEFDMRDYALAALTLVQAERDAARQAYADACKCLTAANGERDAMQQERDELRAALDWCESWFAKHSPTAVLVTGQQAEHPMLSMIRAALTPKATQPTSEASRGR